MYVNLERIEKTDEYTIGMLSINNRFECYTLEDAIRDEKVYGRTCIPTGTYKIIDRRYGGFYDRYSKWNWHKGMLQLKEVPNFTNILIHCGNTAEDTKGCILVGVTHNDGFLASSRVAYKSLYTKVYPYAKEGELTLDIT